MIQIIALIVIGLSGYFWYSTGDRAAIFICGFGCGLSAMCWIANVMVDSIKRTLEGRD